jgi:hypothetical protein
MPVFAAPILKAGAEAEPAAEPVGKASVVKDPLDAVVLPIGVFWIEPKVALLPAPRPRSAAVIGAG